MDEVFIQNVQTYAARHQLQLAARLGFGIHGIIFAAEDKRAGGQTAVKVHRESEPYQRERQVYERLQRIGVTRILGFNVPN